MKLAINLTLSFGMLALCAWLVWPSASTRHDLGAVLHALRWADFSRYLFTYLALMMVVHLCRSLRWNNLLAPIGAKVPTAPLIAISSVGMMAILALPARLGELVRPGLLRKRGVSATAALGTVAVERIVDGLLVSLFVFGAFLSLHNDASPGWMMPTAYASLGIFSVALIGLVCAMRWPTQTVAFGLRVTLVRRLAPRLAAKLEGKALAQISGFDVLKDRAYMTAFMAWSVLYWGATGLCVHVLAKAFSLELSLVGAYGTMALLAVGATLPNSPGLVGQFQWFTLLGLSLYLGKDATTEHTELYVRTFAFANMHYLLQVIWYVSAGASARATRYVSLHDVWTSRRPSPSQAEA